FGVLKYQWYIEEIAAIFLVTGIAVGIVGKLQVTEITDAFIAGARDLVGTALVVALARGILIIAKQGLIIDTILYSLSSVIDSFHPIVSAQSMLVVQTIINFFIPSGSGQAALTMPIMAPLADLAGVTRQTAVLAFQFGDGFSNMIIPTSAVTMGVLTLADIPWQKWARWILPLEVLFLILGFILLIPPVLFNWQ
ncbi:MAG: YfcC family protein, partial [Calditrichales bacterium]